MWLDSLESKPGQDKPRQGRMRQQDMMAKRIELQNLGVDTQWSDFFFMDDIGPWTYSLLFFLAISGKRREHH